MTVADATSLPFVDGAFDAIFHSDVMCCLSGKQAVFDECRRILKGSGRMVFTALVADEDLPFEEASERMQAGAEFVVSELPYDEMLGNASFGCAVEDWTDEFVAMAERLDRARSSRAEGLVALFGEDEAMGMVKRPRWNIDAVGDGVLKRHLYVADPV